MLRNTIAVAIMLLSTNVFAGSAAYDFRFESLSRDFDNDTNTAGVPDGWKMYFNRIRIDFKGDLNEMISYRLRFRFDKTFGASNERDKVGEWVDFAYVTHKMSDMFALTVGKYGTDIGGYEAAMSADRYAMSGIFGNPGSSAGYLVHSKWAYVSGVKGAFTFGDHEVAIHAGNQEPVDTTVSANSVTHNGQNKGLMGLTFKGKVAMWSPMFNYHSVDTKPGWNPAAGSTASSVDKGKLTFMGLGNKFDLGDTNIYFDYTMASYKDDSASTFTAAGSTDAYTGMALNVTHKMGMLMPFLEYTSTERKFKTSSAGTETKWNLGTMSLGTHYNVDAKFRYHVAYTMNNAKSDTTGSTEAKWNELILGARLTGDFLKN